MKITITLSDEQRRNLEFLAKSLSVDVDELASAAVNDLLERPEYEFEKAASYVLEKNRELYDRLK